jgi:hypothetical protein
MSSWCCPNINIYWMLKQNDFTCFCLLWIYKVVCLCYKQIIYPESILRYLFVIDFILNTLRLDNILEGGFLISNNSNSFLSLFLFCFCYSAVARQLILVHPDQSIPKGVETDQKVDNPKEPLRHRTTDGNNICVLMFEPLIGSNNAVSSSLSCHLNYRMFIWKCSDSISITISYGI